MMPWEKPSIAGQSILYLAMLLIAVVVVFPFLYVIAVSFSGFKDVASGNLFFFPLHPTLEAYRWLLQGGAVVQALGISLFVTVAGTAVSLFITVTMAYGLSRKHIPGGKFVLWLVMLTLLITPSLITKYLVVRQFGMIDTLWALIIPSAVSPFNLIVMRQFFMSIPNELIESAKLDGANDVQILWGIILPLSKAALAAIGLFYAVAIWNSFFEALIYLNNSQLYPISVVLRLFVLQGTQPADATTAGQVAPPDLTVQMAVVVLATVPILLVYPFLQKHFTKGVLTGSIKG
ncbi:MAG TPA: carbohydrate ABC transporter permease [Ktedonosporobacter sp.]|nr:carbohydrate ABC transporter permease [Ktedonosporobacter sp.]